MIPQYKYYRPKTLNELKNILGQLKDNIHILAGGTDIVPGFIQESKRFTSIQDLIDINSIPELKTIKEFDGKVSIGAAVTFSEVIKNEIIRKYFPLLVKAAQTVGSVQIRNRATIVGNFVNNAPCADSVPPLLVYDASIKIISPAGEHITPLSKFLLNPYETQLNKNECVTEILLPIPTNNYIGDFYKLGRRSAVSISRISLAFLLHKEENIIKEFRIASGAITPIGKRFYEIEKAFEGKEISSETFMEIASAVGEEVLKTTGLRWSTAYKLPVVQQMLYQLLERNAGGSSR
ncbi:MAG: xanthine dehydrogenase family protein subunit M [Ignavibacteriaceae bacterium]|nr:xanthine dehydrogenase family protein subunit M [Ignavibacteriaceae bacterium]